MLKDLRYAFRTIRRSPGFAVAAVLSIGLAIGANGALFSLADALLLRPLPLPQASEIVTLSTRASTGRLSPFGGLSYQDYVDFREANRSFTGLALYKSLTAGFTPDVNIQPQLKTGFAVSPNFFEALRVPPQIGRGFRRDEGQAPGRDPLIVLAHDLWMNELGGNPSVVGRQVRLNGMAFEVIGVAPESFTGMNLYQRPAFYIPATMEPAVDVSHDMGILTDRRRRSYDVKGHLKPGVSLDAANAEAVAIFGALQKSHPETNRNIGGAVRSELRSRLDVEPVTPYVMALLGLLVMIVLAIACANVANLIVSRARARVRESAIRLAIGASRWRLVRHLMAESVVIAALGGTLGLAVAALAVRLFPKIEPPGDVPTAMTIQVDQRVLWVTLVAVVASAILCGFVPALLSARTEVLSALKSGGSGRGRRRLLGRAALVSVQIAGSLVLLIAGIQLSRGFSVLLDTNPGYRTDRRLTMRMDPSLAGLDSPQVEQFYRTLLERTREVPGVRSAALSSWIPMSDDWRSISIAPEGFQFPPGQESASVVLNTVDHHYIDTLGVPVVRGRGFLATDTASSPLVVVVNEMFARKYLKGDPLGQRIRLISLGDRTAEIVGVTPTGKNISIIEPPIDLMYLPFSQHPQARMTLTVEGAGDAAAMAAPLRELVRSIAPGVPVYNVRTLRDVYEQRSTKIATLVRGIVGYVGILGLSLALIGLYAVVAYQVNLRTREIGIRMAVGANRVNVLRMVLKQASVMGVSGVVIGLAIGLAVAPGLTIIGNRPAYDSMLFTLAPLALLLTTLLAAAIPARRASLIDPQQALRQD